MLPYPWCPAQAWHVPGTCECLSELVNEDALYWPVESRHTRVLVLALPLTSWVTLAN